MENLQACTLALTTALVGFGCASVPAPVKMDPHRPIETEHGYQQDGEDLDRADMVDQLSRERASASDVSRAKTLSTISVILAAAGGALIGWPVGEKLGGSSHPTWPLAYAGGAAVVVSIPVALWASSSLGSAVDAHNRVTGVERDARDAPLRRAGPRRGEWFARFDKPYCTSEAALVGASY